uniref:polynucleotide adenylyltransferase n=1 Tax=Meloidogyne enterolobii TaxID=390850 RepID=A0A6V7W1H4_MELEN|nr:unnamed protein product [Meloidogyne enterolobii]
MISHCFASFVEFDRRVTDIKRITEAWIKLIEFKIFGVDIDIAFVGLPEWPLKENSDEWLNAVLASNKNNALTKLQPISGYSSNKYLINLLNNKENNNKMPITFCNALIALKIWAKNNSIYGNINGFLNGAALTLLLAKVFLFYPNASTIALIERFFLTYLTWNWPTPVRLKNPEKMNDIHSWSIAKEISAKETNIKPLNDLFGNLRNNETTARLLKHSRLIMPIITPIYPEQSAAFNVNYSTHKIIMKTLFEGLKMLREVNIVGLRTGAIGKAWERWIKGIKFEEKYEHFILAVCATKIGNEHFCGYASTKLKLHLIWTIEEKNEFNQVEYCHISNLVKEEFCNGEAAKLLGNDTYCEIRLIGMQLLGELDKSEIEERFEVLSKNIIDGYRLPTFMKDKSGISFKLFHSSKAGLKNW